MPNQNKVISRKNFVFLKARVLSKIRLPHFETTFWLKSFFAALVILSVSSAHAMQCGALFTEAPFRELPENLREFNQDEIRNLSARQVRALNESTLETLRNYTPPFFRDRVRALSMKMAQMAINVTKRSKVVGTKVKDYEHEDVSIGYCFGRATYLHLLLLKMGLQKESVMKIWAVGEMKAADIKWDYHVATVVYTHEMGWVVLDTILNRPVSVEYWMKTFQRESTDGKLRIYLTPPEKFNFTIGKYPRSQMGLDLPRENDWFKGYFVDLVNEIRTMSLESVGLKFLKKMTPEEQAYDVETHPRKPVQPTVIESAVIKAADWLADMLGW